jgi:hypothetical protein
MFGIDNQKQIDVKVITFLHLASASKKKGKRLTW